VINESSLLPLVPLHLKMRTELEFDGIESENLHS
jgi:hypothetical protein